MSHSRQHSQAVGFRARGPAAMSKTPYKHETLNVRAALADGRLPLQVEAGSTWAASAAARMASRSVPARRSRARAVACPKKIRYEYVLWCFMLRQMQLLHCCREGASAWITCSKATKCCCPTQSRALDLTSTGATNGW